MTRVRRRRAAVALGVGVVLVVVVLAAVVGSRVGRSQPQPSASTDDAQVLVTHVELQQRDRSYTVASVVAVVQGDQAFLRVELVWPDEDPGADPEPHPVPVMGATVTHHEPYAGLTAACGQTGSVAPSQVQGPVTLELPCEGLLVPDDVATVELSD